MINKHSPNMPVDKAENTNWEWVLSIIEFRGIGPSYAVLRITILLSFDSTSPIPIPRIGSAFINCKAAEYNWYRW